VRVTHLPTGLMADIHHERSQHANDRLANRLLAARLWAFNEDRARAAGPAVRVRHCVLDPYRRVHDPRTGAESADPEAVLDGAITPFLAAWARRGL
jgi:peptide chain release factor 2